MLGSQSAFAIGTQLTNHGWARMYKVAITRLTPLASHILRVNLQLAQVSARVSFSNCVIIWLGTISHLALKRLGTSNLAESAGRKEHANPKTCLP